MINTARGDFVMKRKISALVLVIIIILTSVFCFNSTAVYADESGSCGTDAQYSYDSTSKTLTITGTGDMKDYRANLTPYLPPWYSYKAEITAVIIGDEITSVGSYAFNDCTSLSLVTIGSSVTSIGNSAFNNTRITNIELPESVASLGISSFANCSFLASVTVYNPDCSFSGNDLFDPFYNSSQTITFYGHSGSTTQAYVEDNPSRDYLFVSIDPCDHASTHEVVTLEPTCSEGGISTQVCDDCGFPVSTTTLSKLGHDYTLEATDDRSEENGHIYNYYCCSRCGDEHTEIQHTAYIEGYYTYSNTATCTSGGIETYTCNVDDCGKVTRSVVSSSNHTVENVTVTKEPTCTEKGEQSGVCSVCGETVTQEIDALGHTKVFVETVDNTEADGHSYDFYVCSVCNEEIVDITHNEWVDGYYESSVITEPTCVLNGVGRDTCTVCNQTRLTSIAASGAHDWYETSRTEPKCTSVGTIYYACSNCDRTKTESIPALGHTYVKNDELSSEPTCTAAGNTYNVCEVCGNVNNKTIEALGHTAAEDSYVIVKEPDCLNDGETTAVCETCGETYSIVTSALGHDYVNIYTDIDEKPGHQLSTPACSRCGDVDTLSVSTVHNEWIEGYYTTAVITQGSCTVSRVTRDTCSLCGETRNNTVQAQGHKYTFTQIDSNGRMSYTCSVCNNVYTALPSTLKSIMWSSIYINTAPEDNTNGYLFEFNGDGIINAKDYAFLVQALGSSADE